MRLLTYSTYLDADFLMLEDLLDAFLTGRPNGRLSAYLTSHSGIPTLLHFTSGDLQVWERGVIASYHSVLYLPAEVLSTSEAANCTSLLTSRHLYQLHPAHVHTDKLSEHEVRKSRADCASCADLLFLGDRSYHVLRPGTLTCKTKSGTVDLQLPADRSLFLAAPYLGCSNDLLSFGLVSMQVPTTFIYLICTCSYFFINTHVPFPYFISHAVISLY